MCASCYSASCSGSYSTEVLCMQHHEDIPAVMSTYRYWEPQRNCTWLVQAYLCSIVGSPLQGRESEWLFAHPEGQWAVARDCLSKRVILIVLNRGHEFTASKSVQAELSPLVEHTPLHMPACPCCTPLAAIMRYYKALWEDRDLRNCAQCGTILLAWRCAKGLADISMCSSASSVYSCSSDEYAACLKAVSDTRLLSRSSIWRRCM